MDLFAQNYRKDKQNIPLAERMRPTSLDAFVGQKHLVGKGEVLRKIIESKKIPSMIFWGPPGVGKTTLANIISKQLDLPFYNLSAISSGVKELREVIQKAKFQTNTILFIDEIHRFSKSQQDALLGAVESGDVTLIGATTENPSFEVNSALISRCQVYTLKSISEEELYGLMDYAIHNDILLSKKNIVLLERKALYQLSGGDARKLLNLLELVIENTQEGDPITDELVVKIAQQITVLYDKTGEMHYDIISAFIKSIRGSDPSAAVYYLARMIEGGEDAKFIARRLLILASEDIGNANPTAFIMANNCFQAVNVIGFPESRIILSQCVIYLACSPKSNASYEAIGKAQALVQQTGNLTIPLHLRNAPTKFMKEEGYGKDYQYAHAFDGNFVEQEFLPKEISNTLLYYPQNNARENEFRAKLKLLWKDKYGY